MVVISLPCGSRAAIHSREERRMRRGRANLIALTCLTAFLGLSTNFCKADATTSGTWSPLSHPLCGAGQPCAQATAPLLLTDGTVIIHVPSTASWLRLPPDINGSYVNGSWSPIASLPAGYAPLYFASQVLPDGRVIINGGEYNFGVPVWTTLGAIYDPLTNTWASVAPPSGWTTIGDAQSSFCPMASTCWRIVAPSNRPSWIWQP